jgi:hypothetical protein
MNPLHGLSADHLAGQQQSYLVGHLAGLDIGDDEWYIIAFE